MADIFISYKREDRRVAERLSIALEQLGFDVWWDFELMSGDRFRRVIEKVIDECKAVIVLWSELARESDFVLDEATYAKSQEKLCPARIDECRLPMSFGQNHTDDLRSWDGELDHEGLASLLRALESKVGKKARLGATARTQADEERFAELEAFKAAQIAGDAKALREFIRQYPKGAFAGFVRGQLETVGAGAPTPPPRRDEPPPRRPPPTNWQPPPRDVSHDAPAPPPPAKSPPWPMILAGAAVAIALVATLVALAPRPAPSEPEIAADTSVEAPAEAVDPAAAAAALEAARRAAREEAAAEFAAREQDLRAQTQREIELREQLAREEAARAAREQAARASAQPPPTTQRAATTTPFDLAQLHPSVRAAAERARANQTRAIDTARQARDAALRGRQAAVLSPRNGVGYGEYSGGIRYEGEFSSGVKSGVGVLSYENHENVLRYEGGFANDQRNGYGVFHYRNGERYSGSYSGDQRSGAGVYPFNDGRRYEGEWANGKENGYGVMWNGDGTIAFAGTFNDNAYGTRMAP